MFIAQVTEHETATVIQLSPEPTKSTSCTFTSESNPSNLCTCGMATEPGRMPGMLYEKSKKLNNAINTIKKLEFDNKVLTDKVATMKTGFRKIGEHIEYMQQKPLRYKYNPKIFK